MAAVRLTSDACALMRKTLKNRTQSLSEAARDFLQDAREWSRPVRVVGQAIADVRKTKADLIAENALLRQQLIAAKRHLGRPQVSKPEKLAITLWARLTTHWQTSFLLFQPDTVLRWHREMFRVVWWRKSRPKGNAKAKLARETVKLIMGMARSNRTWGAERIRGELLKLGVVVAKRTIQKYMRMARKGNSPGGQTWSTFLKNHAHEIWSCDFVQTYDLRFRQIFAFVIIQHDTREVVYQAATYHPTQEWTAQQLRNATFDAAPRFLIRDGDGKFGSVFDDVARGADIEVIRSLHPNMNAFCERFIGTLRRECLDHVLLVGEEHMRRLVSEYVGYFNECRPHQGNCQSIPLGAANDNVVAAGDVVARAILGGLHHSYRRAATA